MNMKTYSSRTPYTQSASPAPRGYVAVVSAIILSIILGVLLLSEGTSIFWNRGDEADRENHRQALALAQSCIYEGLLLYAEDPGLSFKKMPVSINAHTSCVIDTVITQGNTETFVAHADVKNVRVIVGASGSKGSSGTFSITSWKELTSIPP
jgi:hypothetical protein